MGPARKSSKQETNDLNMRLLQEGGWEFESGKDQTGGKFTPLLRTLTLGRKWFGEARKLKQASIHKNDFVFSGYSLQCLKPRTPDCQHFLQRHHVVEGQVCESCHCYRQGILHIYYYLLHSQGPNASREGARCKGGLLPAHQCSWVRDQGGKESAHALTPTLASRRSRYTY